jgi:hypothetical protein
MWRHDTVFIIDASVLIANSLTNFYTSNQYREEDIV